MDEPRETNGIKALSMPTSCVQLLQEMVSFDTSSMADSVGPGPVSAFIDYLESLALGWGLDCCRLSVQDNPPNLLIWHEVNSSSPWLVFDSHIDTVSTKGMSIDPFDARILDGRMYGRGSCDTKASGAAMLWSLKELVGNSQRSTNVAILFSVAEETTQAGAATFVDLHLPKLGWSPVGIIVGEPTMMVPVIATNGVMRWRITTKGIAAHSSAPELGRSAISDMVRVIDRLESEYIPTLTASNPLTGRARFSINVISGGSQINIIPDTCVIEVDRRLVPGELADDVFASIECLLAHLSVEHPGMRLSQEQPFAVSPLDPDRCKVFSNAVAGVLKTQGFEGEPYGTPYSTNASSFCRSGIPAVVLGPGDIAQAHTHDEWIDIDQIQLGIQGYRALMIAPAETWV